MSHFCEIPVMVTSKEVVAPLSHHLTTTVSRLPLSNLDYFMQESQKVSVYLCYAKPNEADGGDHHHRFMVGILRESLARTLAHFSVFAGEVVANSDGEPESLLSNRGVDFFEATSEMELRGLDLYHPDVSIRGCFVPDIQQGVLAVQATEMKCGGLVVGITFDHRVADAYSANMFLLSWSETAHNGHPTSYVPIVDRSLLRPSQSVAAFTTPSVALDKWYTHLPRDELLSLPGPTVQLESRMFYVEAETLKELQEKACLNNEGKECFRTKYEAFTAFLWQLLAKSATDASATFKIVIPVDGRTRMYADKSTQNAALMHHYFGNVLSTPFTVTTVGSLRSMSLSDVADLIHFCKAEAMSPKHFFNLIDWVEERMPMMPLSRVITCFEEEVVIVSSGQRFPVSKLDFGWGKPAFGSYYFPLKGELGYVMPMPSATKDGDWVVFMYLKKRHMEVVEKEGGHVFKPLLSWPKYQIGI